jgi:hypothetical protein
MQVKIGKYQAGLSACLDVGLSADPRDWNPNRQIRRPESAGTWVVLGSNARCGRPTVEDEQVEQVG